MTGDARELIAVPRPLKSAEFQILFQGKSVVADWTDCLASAHNAMVDAWDALTASPDEESARQYQLRGDEAYRDHQGKRLPQWEYKFSDGGRILYLLDAEPVRNAKGRQTYAGRVIVVEASPGHPKHTERIKGPRKSPGRQ
ncbi:MAG: hypothetical protein ACYC3W_05320 [Candidatus Nanopelagicales bacterium]